MGDLVLRIEDYAEVTLTVTETRAAVNQLELSELLDALDEAQAAASGGEAQYILIRVVK